MNPNENPFLYLLCLAACWPGPVPLLAVVFGPWLLKRWGIRIRNPFVRQRPVVNGEEI